MLLYEKEQYASDLILPQIIDFAPSHHFIWSNLFVCVHPFHMVARKRRQGQARRLRNYLKSQNGTDDPHALLQRCDQLKKGLAQVEADLAQLTEREKDGLVEVKVDEEHEEDTEQQQKDRTRATNQNLIVQARHDQRTRLEEMRKDLSEMLAVNERLYARLVPISDRADVPVAPPTVVSESSETSHSSSPSVAPSVE
tara:strand:+ start:110 stop:700 length:591 start_codon:yes stop_codon:yes gene_type:complete